MLVETTDRIPRRDGGTHIHVLPGSVPDPDAEPYRQPLPERPLEPRPDRVREKELPEKPEKRPYVSPFTPN